MGFDEKICKKMHMAMVNADEIRLTEDQVDQIKALKLKLKKDMIQYEAKIDTIGIDLKSEIWKDDIDTKTVDTLIDEKYTIKADKKKALVAYLVEFKSIMNEDQQDKFKDLCWKSKK